MYSVLFYCQEDTLILFFNLKGIKKYNYDIFKYDASCSTIPKSCLVIADKPSLHGCVAIAGKHAATEA